VCECPEDKPLLETTLRAPDPACVDKCSENTTASGTPVAVCNVQSVKCFYPNLETNECICNFDAGYTNMYGRCALCEKPMEYATLTECVTKCEPGYLLNGTIKSGSGTD